jgi:hypothetical protein
MADCSEIIAIGAFSIQFVRVLFSSIIGRYFEVSQHQLPDRFTSVHIPTFLYVM